MVRSLVIVAFLASSGFGQIFPGAFWNRAKQQDSCPGGVCPTNQSMSGNWTNRDGLSHRQHVESAHGVSTAGMSEAQVQAHMNSYHNTYGAGHPVRGVAADVARVAAAPVKAVVQNQQVRREARYPAVSSGGVNYGSNGGSSGGISVGSRDSDGAVITSVGTPTLAPPLASATGSILARKTDFRTALMKAAKASRESGEITVAQYFKIAAMSRVPKIAANLEASIHEAAIEEGIATAQAPDWDAIIEFIEKLIPLIIQLIDLFS